MVERVSLHILYGDTIRSQELACLALAAGHSAEIYASIEDFLARAPGGGVTLAHDNPPGEGVALVIDALSRANKRRPVVAFAERPQISAVVRAVRAGAFDYILTPDQIGPLNEVIASALREVKVRSVQYARSAEAHRLVALLSPREREVIERIAAGKSNKIIAYDLGLSPRTVEIHRMKMMGKLGACHVTEAVLVWIEAGRA